MSVSELLPILIALFSISVLFLGLLFLWQQWIYRDLPSFRLDTKWLLKIVTRQYPKNVPSTSVFFNEFLSMSRKLYQEELCIMWMLRPYLLIYHENTMKIFSSENVALNKASMYENFKEAYGDSLIGSYEDVWKVHRKLLNPAFSLTVLKSYMHIFNQNAKILINKFENTVGKPTEDMLNILKRCTFNILAASIYDLNMKEEMFESRTGLLIRLIEEMSELIVYKVPRPWLNWYFLSPIFSAEKRYKEVLKNGHICMDEIIDDLITSVKASKVEGKCSENGEKGKRTLAEILIEQHLQDSTFTRDYVRDHFITFLSAGYHTIAYSLMWCLYLLGHHPEVQKNACKEIESIVNAKEVTYEDLGKLKYLECVIKESLRLYCTIPAYGRKLSKDIRYGKYTIPKGTELLFLPFLLHRNPNIYPEAMKFKPERFADSSNIRPWIHAPFGAGLRDCIGKRFAMMEMKVLLVHVLRQFQITSLDTVENEDLDWSIVLKTTKPLRMLFEIRPSEL